MTSVTEYLIDYPEDKGVLEIRYVDGHIDRINFKDNPETVLHSGRFIRNVVLGVCKHLHINIGPTIVGEKDVSWIGQVVVTDKRTETDHPIAQVTLNGKQVLQGDIDNDFWINEIKTVPNSGDPYVNEVSSNTGPSGVPYIKNGYRTIRVRPTDSCLQDWYDLKVVRNLNGKGYFGSYPDHISQVKIDDEVVKKVPMDWTLTLTRDIEKNQYLTDLGLPVTFILEEPKPGILEECSMITDRHRVYHYTDNAGVVWQLETYRDMLIHVQVADVEFPAGKVSFTSSRHFELINHLRVTQPVNWSSQSENIVQ